MPGPTGPAGAAGATGPTGPTGAAGALGPNPYNLYVQAGAAPGGDGSQAAPFDAIDQALAAALPGGIIHLLRGTYPVTQQLAVQTPGLTLRGTAGAVVVLQAPVVPFLLNGDDDTLADLTITSDNPYPVEFIQLAGNGDRILNCQIYGPNQPGDSSTWVVNRGFVTQGNATNVLAQGNVFHTLRQPAYLNPGSTGTIIQNVVYNTRGFVVDGATFLFSGNSWGLPANAVDIALLAGTPSGAPYDPPGPAGGQQQQRHGQRPALGVLGQRRQGGLGHQRRADGQSVVVHAEVGVVPAGIALPGVAGPCPVKEGGQVLAEYGEVL